MFVRAPKNSHGNAVQTFPSYDLVGKNLRDFYLPRKAEESMGLSYDFVGKKSPKTHEKVQARTK